MEVAPGKVPGLAGLPPDVALWLLELRGGLGLPIAWDRPGTLADDRIHDPLDLEVDDAEPDGCFAPLLRSATLEDLSLSDEHPSDGPNRRAMDVLSPAASTMESETTAQVSDLDSDHDSDRSVDSLEEEEEASRAVPMPPVRPLPRLPPPPPEDDMLARLSGGEFRALPAVLEEDEEDLTQDEDDDDDDNDEEEEEDESVTVLQALGWAASLDEPSSSSYHHPTQPLPPPPPALRRTFSAGADMDSVVLSLRRTSSAPQLLPITPVHSPTPSPTPSPTLTAATPSSSSGRSALDSLSTSTACAEALESAEALCRDLDDEELADRTLSQSVSVDEDMVFDDEFLALCSEANRLVETCLHRGSSPRARSPTSTDPVPGPSSAPDLAPAPQRMKVDVNSIFDDGLSGADPPQPPARKRRKARLESQQHVQHVHLEQVVDRRRCSGRISSESSALGSTVVEVGVRCHTSELLLMTRASERTHLKRSRSVSAADRDPAVVKPALCASSPELSSPQSPSHSGTDKLVLDNDLCSAPDVAATPVDADDSDPTRRKGSVSSDVIAWQLDLLQAGLSDSEDAEAALSCLETKQWFSSSDNKGRVYFFEENSTESSWNLPDVHFSIPQDSTFEDECIHPPDEARVLSSTPVEDDSEKVVKMDRSEKQEKLSLRNTKSRSMVIVDSGVKDSKNLSTPRNWPQLFDGDMCVLKEGSMYRTKITENGKKLRKNWASSHVVLTELFLLLFRDAKSFTAMKSSTQGAPRPELCVDLNGALIDHVDRGDKASVTSRKNVFLVSTVLGLQVLFQCDSSQQAEDWYIAVHTAIHNLPSGFDSCPRIKVTKEMDRLFGESNSPEQAKKFPRIGRSKSVKIKNKDGSIEDLTVSVAERQTKIKARLKKFFNRRPTMESLVKKGIWKDEPAFGCYLEQVCNNESPRVPLFVQRCIAVIESSEDNMKTDGLYRASGNLSQVQKIRLQVDQNNLSALDQEEDVHVLTGALKLFFRELKEPLIPYAAFSKAIKASTLQNKKEKLSQFREIVKSLPTANHDTLKVLLKHLLKVTAYQEFNRMHIPNLAIVFGPTLMWPEQESLNMALDLMQQNLVIEAFLLDFDHIFR